MRNHEQANETETLLKAALSSYAHDAWGEWMRYLFSKSIRNSDGTVTIPAGLVKRWERQMDLFYHELPEEEQKSGMVEAEKMISLMHGFGF